MTSERTFLGRRQPDRTESLEAILRQEVRALTGRVQTLEAENKELREQHALVDPLTGLMNERAMAMITEKVVSNAVRDGKDVAAFTININGLKGINDSMGHACGDMVLKEAAKRMAEEVRLGDYVFRKDEDKFVIIAVGVNSPAALKLAERIKATLKVEGPIIPGQEDFGIKVTIGHAVYSESSNNVSLMLDESHTRMYLSKPARGEGTGRG